MHVSSEELWHDAILRSYGGHPRSRHMAAQEKHKSLLLEWEVEIRPTLAIVSTNNETLDVHPIVR